MSTAALFASAEPGATRPKRLRPEHALWLKASLLATFLAASSAPSPLYAIYREAWGFSALTLTLVFGGYAIALLAALLVFGKLSDHRGRRIVVLAALVLQAVSMVLFWHAPSVAWLIGARLLQGVATGIATSALSAGLVDLHRERGALVNSVAPMFGMAIGALGASALVQFSPAPTRLVFESLLLVFAVQFVIALYLPETAPRRPGAWRSLVPSISIPARARATLWRLLPVTVAQWALGGFYLSLGPTLTRVVTGMAAPMVGGALIATLVTSSAVAILLLRRRTPHAVLASGAAGLAVGLGITLAGIQLHSTAALFAGSAVAGLGFGASFSASLRSLVPLAEPHERAGLMASFFVLSYLAFSLPAIAAGLFAGRFGLQPTALGYGLVLMAMATAAFLALRLRPQASLT